MRILSLFGIGFLAACSGSGDFECSEEKTCGFGAVCIEGTCVTAACSTSAQCPMEHYCLSRQCVPGCQGEDDCYPGSMCDLDAGVCSASPCVDSSVDCGYREFCNVGTGECYDAGGQYCKPCDRDNELADCGEGNICWAGYCGVNCENGQECPSGFECYPFTDDHDNIVTYQCVTYCWLYDDYEPGSFVSAPPEGLNPLYLNSCPADLPPAEAL